MTPAAAAAVLATAVLAAGCGTRAGSGTDSASVAQANDRADAALLRNGVWKTDFSRHTVPLKEFQPGGPGKDGIPALDRPHFLAARRVDFLKPQEPVIALVHAGSARAYPLQILVWHEIVNDRVGGTPVAVTFCPLCNTAIAFDRRVGGRTLDFGTTGNLRNSDLVMYDRETESWWQQFGGAGVVGHYAGSRLKQIPARIVAWRDFRDAHPEGLVLSRKTGYTRSYGTNPYAGYDDASSPPFFPVRNGSDRRLQPKERVVYLERDGRAVVVPRSTLAKRGRITVALGAHRFDVRLKGGVSSALDSGIVADGRDVGSVTVTEDGRPVAFSEPFWFAVAAFRPDATIVR